VVHARRQYFGERDRPDRVGVDILFAVSRSKWIFNVRRPWHDFLLEAPDRVLGRVSTNRMLGKLTLYIVASGAITWSVLAVL
jgi:hypothetical protein